MAKRLRSIPPVIPHYPPDNDRGAYAPQLWYGDEAVNAADGPWYDAPPGSIYVQGGTTTGGLYHKVADTGAASDWQGITGTVNSTVGIYNVLDYGATGDGTTDDTAAIQAAIDAASAVTPAGRVVLPRGIYAISDPITISTSGVALLGVSGWARATILCTTADSGIVVDAGGGAITYQVEIGNLYINGAEVGETGLKLVNPNESSFHDILIINTVTQALQLSGTNCDINSFQRILVNVDTTDAIGVLVEGGATNWFSNCNMYGGTTAFAFDGSINNVQIDACWFEGWETVLGFDHTSGPQNIYNVYLRDSYLLSTKGGGTYTARIIRCITDNNTYAGVYRNIQVTSCYIATTAAKYVVEITWGGGIGAGSSRFFGLLADNHYAGSNGTAWLYSEPSNTVYEYVHVLLHNNLTHEGTALPLQDGTTRAYVKTITVASGDAAPAAGPWLQGDIVWNSDPDSGEYIGWVCTEAGSPGTWKGFGAIA